MRQTHVDDYSSIFGRVNLDLGQVPSEKTTDKLLKAYNDGSASDQERRYLEVMLFQYGRYLTIESSRETPEDDPSRATLPSNLQGIWVGGNNSAWHSDYHMNVNLQMNYWPTYSTNMAECAQPLISYVDSLREPGRVTAKFMQVWIRDLWHIPRTIRLDGLVRDGHLTGDGRRQRYRGFFRIAGNTMNLQVMYPICKLHLSNDEGRGNFLR